MEETKMVPLSVFLKKNWALLSKVAFVLIISFTILFFIKIGGPSDTFIQKYDLAAKTAYSQYLAAGKIFSNGITSLDNIKSFEYLNKKGEQIYNIKTSFLAPSDNVMPDGITGAENSIKIEKSSIIEMNGEVYIKENKYSIVYDYEIIGLGNKVKISAGSASIFDYEYSTASGTSTWSWNYGNRLNGAFISGVFCVITFLCIYSVIYWNVYFFGMEISKYKKLTEENIDETTQKKEKRKLIAKFIFGVIFATAIIMPGFILIAVIVTSL
jgi:hypothetical protein